MEFEKIGYELFIKKMENGATLRDTPAGYIVDPKDSSEDPMIVSVTDFSTALFNGHIIGIGDGEYDYNGGGDENN